MGLLWCPREVVSARQCICEVYSGDKLPHIYIHIHNQYYVEAEIFHHKYMPPVSYRHIGALKKLIQALYSRASCNAQGLLLKLT